LDNDIALVANSTLETFNRIGSRRGSESQSYVCLFFLTKSSYRGYVIDKFILYGDLINKNPPDVFESGYDLNIIDEWILKNIDK